MDSSDQNDLQALQAFLNGLPDSVGRLRHEDARFYMRLVASHGIDQNFSFMQTTQWAEKMGSTGFCNPQVFFTRLTYALGMAFNLIDVEHLTEVNEAELVKWVKTLQASRPGHDSESSGPQFRYT